MAGRLCCNLVDDQKHGRKVPFAYWRLLLFASLLAPVAGFTCEGEHMSDEVILRLEPIKRLIELGNISDAEHFLQRTFLSPASIKASQIIQQWMEDAGLVTWVDQIGNVHGRASGANASAPALLLGSHLDTVIDAGIFDGSLGIVSAIAAVKAFHVTGKLETFPRPIEVIAFSDEEGVRFQSTFLGSGAVSGQFRPQLLKTPDRRGVTLQSVLQDCSLDGTFESILQLKYDADQVWSYVEVHIEQGPVLERNGYALGVVSAIAGQTRLNVRMHGLQGHAGTVPLRMRKDAMAAAAVSIVSIEHICNHPELYLTGSWEQRDLDHLVSEGALVCTVGSIAAWPGASNVIPGQVTFTVDVRAEEDSVRTDTVTVIKQEVLKICKNRGVFCEIENKQEASAVKCNEGLKARLLRAATAAIVEVSDSDETEDSPAIPILVSGAGHDAMMMAQLTEIGMLFVRCTGGISHSPAEEVLASDVWAASKALKAFLEDISGESAGVRLG